jgi:SAM-dependent methyltransferase
MEVPTDQAFVARLRQAWTDASFVGLALSKPRTASSDLRRVSVRRVLLKGEARMCVVYSHVTRDVTKNLTLEQAQAVVSDLLATAFDHAHLHTATEQIQLKVSKRGKATMTVSAVRADAGVPPDSAAHDRLKHRHMSLDRAFLRALAITDDRGQLVPAMARKWRQINKFVEILDQALGTSGLKAADALSVVDFGCGKGYLTFATHDHLAHTLQLPARVTGVELRSDMVDLCGGVVERLDLKGLRFEQGDVRTAEAAPVDIVIALHACDTATDHAIHLGVRCGAKIIMCSPCCHKELRPQLLSPHPLRPILKHGVHLGQQAEMLTDGLRAMLLDACGYDTKVFEFVALEHTNKNKMILAVKRSSGLGATGVWQQIRDIKDFYGIRQQCLETLLRATPELVQG